jgi:hypothetical protein
MTKIGVVILIFALAFGQGREILDRHNLGYVLHEHSTIHLSSAIAKLSFVVKLAAKVDISEEHLNCTGVNVRGVNCDRIKHVVEGLHRLQFRTFERLQSHVERLNKMFENFDLDARPRRAWLPLIGDILSTVTGLVTHKELSALTDTMRKMELNTLKAWILGV